MSAVIHKGDCQKLNSKVESGSVDMIFTDPPYPKEYLYLYEWLASEADRVLKPDGFLIAYCGPYWKDRVMGYFNSELQYFYDFILHHKNDTSILWPRKLISGYKSLLCYHKKGRKPVPRVNVLGHIDRILGDKRYHKWGQSEYEARYYIDCFTKPGDLVVDYFVGGGTTARVCKKLGRNFVGFEENEADYQTATRRLNSETAPQMDFKQLELS